MIRSCNKTSKPYLQYANDVLDGAVVSGHLVRRACERFHALLGDERYEFREKVVDKVIAFFSVLRHFTGKHAGKKFILQPWQQWVVASIFGFYHKDDGTRLVTDVYIEIARKNGKTAFAAGLCLYCLIADGEMDAEVDLAANSKEQAKIAYKFCAQFAKTLDPKGKQLIPYRDKVKYPAKLSTLQVFAADASKLDGFNASMYLLDEFHAAKNNQLRDVLQSSQGMRDNPLSVIITTAGTDKLGPCYQYREMCENVVRGLAEADTLFAAIFSLDPDDDWKDEANWAKCNPNLGITVRHAYLRKEIKNCVNLPAAESGVRTKNFNQWLDVDETWIPSHYISDISQNVNFDEFVNQICYAGVDLSATRDLTSVSIMVLRDGKYVFKTLYYLPESALSENRFKERYGAWARAGLLRITPGNVTDYDYILNDLLILRQKGLRFYKIGYDAWNATDFVSKATAQGLPMMAISQSLGNFNKPTKELERAIVSAKVVLDNNEITRHCYANVSLARDSHGNIKPSKRQEEKKIDGVIAQLQALAAYQSTPLYKPLY